MALSILAVASVGWPAQRRMKLLRAVQYATARIAHGELDVRVQADRRAGAKRTDEIGDLVRYINRMGEGLQRLEQARRRWLANISYELRSPLAVLRGELEALVDGVRPFKTEAIQSLRDEARRLGALVDDLHLLATARPAGTVLPLHQSESC